MFNFKPENLVGDTNKLLFAILTELQQLNNNVQSLRPVTMDTVVNSIVEQVTEKIKLTKAEKPKKEVVKNGSKRPGESTIRATGSRSKPDISRGKKS